VHRLGELTARQRAVAAVLVVLLAVPFAMSALRAAHVHWLPSGDDALIGLRSWDVFSSHRPLVGQPSTSHLYSPGQSTSHPGPIEFYWLAVPMRLLGPATGMLAGSLVVNLASVLVACWVAFRRGGAAVGAGAAVLAGAVLWAEGTALLTDPISSNAGGIPLLALAALAWAVLDGDHRLVPLAAAFAAWVGQQHLAIAAPAASMAGLAGIGIVAHEVAVRWRVRRAIATGPIEDTADEPTPHRLDDGGPALDDGAELGDGGPALDDAAAPVDDGAGPEPEEAAAREPRRWPWYVAGAAASLVLWLPVLWQEVTGSPGNLTAVLRYAGASDTPPIGGLSGLRQAIRAMGWPPLLTRTDLAGDDFFRGPLTALEVVGAVVGYAALMAIAVRAWARHRTLSLLAATALVLAAAGAVNGAKIPKSIEAFRINFYRWAFVVAWLAWLAIGWAAALGLRRLAARRQDLAALRPRLAPALPALAVVALLVPTLGTALTHPGWDDERRDQVGFPMMRDLGAAAVGQARGHDRVTLVLRGSSANLSTGPAVALQLESHGHHVLVDTVVAPGIEDRFWGGQRILRRGDDPGSTILLLVTGYGQVPDLPGRTVARVRLNVVYRAALARLIPQARSVDEPVASARAESLIAARYGPRDRAYVRDHVMTALPDRPLKLLTDPVVLQMIIDGYYSSPTFDRGALLRLRSSIPAQDVNLDDVFELRVLTRAELAEVVPAWGGP
jgi:hypothetical protein